MSKVPRSIKFTKDTDDQLNKMIKDVRYPKKRGPLVELLVENSEQFKSFKKEINKRKKR